MHEAQVTIEELGATRRRLAVEVPVETVSQELDRAFGRVQNAARIPGFRPGRVPRSLLERYFGDQVRADVLSHLIEHSYSDALSRCGLRPAGPPEIVPENVEAGRPLRYSATVDIFPEIEIRNLEGLRTRRPRRTVRDEDVDRAVEGLRESLAELRPVDDRTAVSPGDFVAIDYSLSIGATPLRDSRRENRLVEVGGGNVPEPIDRALGEMTVGEQRAIDVEFPPEHPDPQVAGKTVRFDLTVRGIREKIVPPADDDLAKEHGECATLEELRAKLRERIADRFAVEADAAVREQVIDEMLSRNPFETPRSLLERQADALVQELVGRLGPQASVLERDTERLAKIREEMRPRAERQVRAVLALDAFARQEGIAVADADLDEQVQETATRLGQTIEKVRAAYEEGGGLEELRGRIRRERALERVVASATIEDVEVDDRNIADAEETG